MKLLEQLNSLFERFGHDLAESSAEVKRNVMTELRSAVEGIREEVDEFVDGLKAYGAEHPEAIFSILRKIHPILVRGDFALVTRYEDVLEVLSRDDVFDVPYAERMKRITDSENFFLGMRDGARYTRDKTNMMEVVRRQDLPEQVRPIVSRSAAELVKASGGQIDVVSQLAQPVPTRLVAEYFGIEGDDNSMIEWTSALFWYLFLDQKNEPEVTERALAASRELNALIDHCIVQRREKGPSKDDVLGRCLRLQAAGFDGMRDLDIRNNLVGLIIGAIPTTATSATFALEELLRRPEELKGAQTAAQEGNEELVQRYVYEALRFRPMNPGIFRTANQDFEVAQGHMHSAKIREGSTVVAATQSAMFDRLHMDRPNDFRTDRSPRDYLLWGYGMHTCFGQYINQVQISGLLMPLLAQPNLRRVEGESGQLSMAGPFAGSLQVQFG